MTLVSDSRDHSCVTIVSDSGDQDVSVLWPAQTTGLCDRLRCPFLQAEDIAVGRFYYTGRTRKIIARVPCANLTVYSVVPVVFTH